MRGKVKGRAIERRTSMIRYISGEEGASDTRRRTTQGKHRTRGTDLPVPGKGKEEV